MFSKSSNRGRNASQTRSFSESQKPRKKWRKLLLLENLEPRLPLSASTAAGFNPVGQQPDGALSGKIVYVSGGHGYAATSNSWDPNRPTVNRVNEASSNQDHVTFFADEAWRAGATVVPMRPVGHQLNEVVLDNDDPQVTYAGTWNNSGSSIFYGSAGDTPYRWTNTSLTQSSTATYTPNIPETGIYPVYTWVRHGSDRTEQLYQVNHSGGTTEVTVDHSKVGNGWVYLGSYEMEAGTSNSVTISNKAGTNSKVVIADAIRFGNGMGDTDRGDGISGRSREDEAALYWVNSAKGRGQSINYFTSAKATEWKSNITAPIRAANLMNRSASGSLSDRVYIGFHSDASSSTSARGTRGLVTTTSRRTPNQYTLANTVSAEINDDLVSLNGQFEHNWFNRSSHVLAGSFGEISNSYASNEFDATIIETFFHTSPVDAELMRDPKVRAAMAQATTQGLVKYFRSVDGGSTPLSFSPDRVTGLRAESNGNGSVTLDWEAPSSNGLGGSPAGYMIYRSLNGKGFDGGTYVAGGSTSSYTVSGLDGSNGTHYFKVTAVNSGGESADSAVVAGTPSQANATVLIVNGFDRNDRGLNVQQSYGNGTVERSRPQFQNSFDYTIQAAEAVEDYSTSLGIDSAQNESVINGDVDLDDYDTVIWILGEESSADSTFSATEQSLVSSYIAAGGNLFVSGSEVAYDLDGLNNGRSFYNNTLGADYVSDDANTYSAVGAAGSIFAGIWLQFDDGDFVYNADSPDVINPLGSSVKAMNYTGSGGGAAIQRAGTGGAGDVVMLGFPFETIVDEADRNAVMAAALNFFGTTPSTGNPPAAPTGFSAAAYNGSVQLDWSDNSESDLAGYNVYRSTTSGGSRTQLNGSPVTNSHFTDATAANGTRYYYVVAAENSSGDESPVSSQVSARPLAVVTRIVDNDDGSPAFTTTSSWAVSGSTGYNGSTYQYRPAGSSGTATWTGNLPYGGQAEVFVQYRAGGNRASSAKYIVNHVGGSTNVFVNQKTNNLQWVSLGTYTFLAGNNSVVLDAAGSSGGTVVIADAARFVMTVPSVAPAAPTSATAVALNSAIGLDWANNTESDLAGYNVYRSNASGGSRVRLNSSLLTTSSFTDSTATNGSTRYYVIRAIDRFGNESGNSAVVSASPSSSAQFIVDNDSGSPAYQESGSWNLSGSSGYNGGTYRYAFTGNSSTATWNQNLAEADYEVLVQYRAGSNRATSARYEVSHANGTSSVTVNQRNNNLTWVSLGTYRFDAGNASVTLKSATSSGGAVIISDAVRFVPQAPSMPTSPAVLSNPAADSPVGPIATVQPASSLPITFSQWLAGPAADAPTLESSVGQFAAASSRFIFGVPLADATLKAEATLNWPITDDSIRNSTRSLRLERAEATVREWDTAFASLADDGEAPDATGWLDELDPLVDRS